MICLWYKGVKMQLAKPLFAFSLLQNSQKIVKCQNIFAFNALNIFFPILFSKHICPYSKGQRQTTEMSFAIYIIASY